MINDTIKREMKWKAGKEYTQIVYRFISGWIYFFILTDFYFLLCAFFILSKICIVIAILLWRKKKNVSIHNDAKGK